MNAVEITAETAATQVRQAARVAAYDKGPGYTFADIRTMVPRTVGDRFLAEQAELAGFPCWTSAPDHLFVNG